MGPLDEVVFLVQDGQVVESSIRNLGGYRDETTTPRGIGPRLHVRGSELWTWGHQGNNPRKVREFETEDEAVAALEESFVYDFWHQSDFVVFRSRAEAEAFLKDGEV